MTTAPPTQGTTVGINPDRDPSRQRRSLLAAGDGGSVAFVAAMALANAGNFAFHLAASRQLGPAHYGALASVLGILLALSLPTSALQVALTRNVARFHHAGGRYSIHNIALAALAVSLVTALALLIIARPITSALDLTGVSTVVWLAAFAPGAMINAVGRGVLLGQQRMLTLAVLTVAATAARVGAAVLLLGPGDSEFDALAITAGAEYLLALTMVVAIFPVLRPHLRRVRLAFGEIATSAGALTGLWILLAADLAAARYLLTPAQSGVFAAAALGARAALFLPQAVANAAHARLSADPTEQGNRVIRLSMLTTVGLCVLNTVAMLAIGPWFITVAFGEAFTPSRSLIVIMTMAASILAVGNLLVHLRLALGRAVGQVWMGVVVIAAATVLLPASTALPAGSGLAASPMLLAAASVVAAAVVVLSLDPGLRVRTSTPAVATDSASPDTDDVSLVVAVRTSDTDGLAEALAARDALERSYRTSVVAVLVDPQQSQATADSDLLDALCVGASVIDLRGQTNEAQAAFGAGTANATARNVVLFDPASGIAGTDLVGLVDVRELYGSDVVVGSRRHVDSVTDYPAPRATMSWAYQQLLSGLFRLKIRDPQVPAKVLHRPVANAVVPRCTHQGAAFEVELMVLANQAGFRRIIEAPINVRPGSHRPMDLAAALGLIGRTMALRVSLWRRGPLQLRAAAQTAGVTA